jgi:serine/threonine-protein kinase
LTVREVQTELPVRHGEILLGKYRVEAIIGSGGMGLVVRATHLQLDQPVALKFLRLQAPSAAEAAVASDRFLREDRATFRLRSEHVVRLLDLGALPDGTAFIVMELLVGTDLRTVLNSRGSLPPREAVDYALQISLALEEAHAHGIVHRDLKPRNIFLADRVDGTKILKVLDFGISKVNSESDMDPLTDPNMALGSPRYMAPEQWLSSATVDARADLFALGMVIYELLTGQVALAGMPLGELIRRLSAGAIPSPRELRADLPEPLCRVVLKALRPHPDERYPTIRHFAQALREALPAQVDGRPRPAMSATAPTAVIKPSSELARTLPVSPASALPPSTERTPAGADGSVASLDDGEVDDFAAMTIVGKPPSFVDLEARALSSRDAPPASAATLASTRKSEPSAAQVVAGPGGTLAMSAGQVPPEFAAQRAQFPSSADLPPSMQPMPSRSPQLLAPAAPRAPQPPPDGARFAPPPPARFAEPARAPSPSSPSLPDVRIVSTPGVPVWLIVVLGAVALVAASAATVLALRP